MLYTKHSARDILVECWGVLVQQIKIKNSCSADVMWAVRLSQNIIIIFVTTMSYNLEFKICEIYPLKPKICCHLRHLNDISFSSTLKLL